MTEIPEHLLKRSKAAKAAKTGGDAGGGDGGDAPSAAVEAVADTPAAPAPTGTKAMADAAASVPADKPAPAPEPDPPYIEAAKRRKKMPVWAMVLVAAVPIWAISYAGTMQEPDVEDILFVDAELFYADGGCAGCHGAGGGGGTGYAFTDGEILATFPDPIDHMVHVARGSTAIQDQPYGDPNRPGGQRISGGRGTGNMPAQLDGLSQIELEVIVFHERANLGGEDTSSAEYQEWMDEMRERLEAGEDEPIDLDRLLACANPDMTPGATGDGEDCPGPHSEGDEVAAAE